MYIFLQILQQCYPSQCQPLRRKGDHKFTVCMYLFMYMYKLCCCRVYILGTYDNSIFYLSFLGNRNCTNVCIILSYLWLIITISEVTVLAFCNLHYTLHVPHFSLSHLTHQLTHFTLVYTTFTTTSCVYKSVTVSVINEISCTIESMGDIV